MSGHTSINIAIGVLVAIAVLGSLAKSQAGPRPSAGSESNLLVGSIVLAVVTLFAIGAPLVSQARGISWLEKLGLPLEPEGYLDALDTDKVNGVLVVEAEVQGGATPEVGKPHSGTINVEPGKVSISSPALYTGALGLYVVPHNASLHRWFRRVCDDVLLPLHRKQPLRSVRVRREG